MSLGAYATRNSHPCPDVCGWIEAVAHLPVVPCNVQITWTPSLSIVGRADVVVQEGSEITSGSISTAVVRPVVRRL